MAILETDNVGEILEKSATSCAVIAVPPAREQRARRRYAREYMRLIVPHVRRAALVGKAFDPQKAVVADFAATVDVFKDGNFSARCAGPRGARCWNQQSPSHKIAHTE